MTYRTLLLFQSPYEGGKFKVELFLPDEYPMAPPKVRFMTKLYHPNIDKLGRVCLDILKGKFDTEALLVIRLYLLVCHSTQKNGVLHYRFARFFCQFKRC